MERIDFEILPLEKEVPKKVFEAYVAIHKDFIEYKVDYFSDYTDDVVGMLEDTYSYFHQIAEKSAVRGFYIQYLWKIKHWKVVIVVNSFADDWYIVFNDEKKSKSFLKKLMAWKFPYQQS
jgi:hypothetical protein